MRKNVAQHNVDIDNIQVFADHEWLPNNVYVLAS
jgi:hypothetical protein